MSQGKRAGRGISGLEKGRESPEVLAFAFLLAGFFLLPLLLASPFSPGGARERESSHVESARPGRIRWHPFGKEAFKLARSEDKPVLLSIVASWCHWCHVMEKETYGDREIARLINSSFIPIRVDRDERPDLDRHFQALLKAFSGESGLPLTAFLTPEGELFWGGTFFPPEDKGGQLGLRSLLPRLYRAYKERRGEVREVARTLSREVAELGARRLKATSLSAPALKALEDALISQTRPRHGGFGQREGPQFPRGPALQFLLTRHFRTGRPGLLLSARLTLDAMARGGIYDQLGGGFHRYAVDPGWRLPHLEKLTGPNAMLLTVYAEAYRATGEERYKRVAHGTADFALRELADRKGGGFFASLDSDSEPGDNGTYYRWRAAEVRALMPEPMARAAILHLGLSPADRLLKLDSLGRIPFIEKSPEEVASTLSLSPSRAEALLEQAKKRLLKARERRKPPSLDRRKYTDLNALMISAFLRAYRALGREDLKSFALLSLEALIRRAYREGEGFCHLCSPAGPRVEGFLRDQAAAALALLDGYEVSGKERYLELARRLLEHVRRDFWDEREGGFFGTRRKSRAGLPEPRKEFEDFELPAENAMMALALDRLYYLRAEATLRDLAEKTLSLFAAAAPAAGPLAGSFGLALNYHLNSPAHVVVIGSRNDSRALRLHEAALRAYRPGLIAEILEPERVDPAKLPAAMRAMLKASPPALGPRAFLCAGSVCAFPTGKPQELRELIKSFGLPEGRKKGKL